MLVLVGLMASLSLSHALKDLLSRIDALPSIKRRAVNSVIGAAVGDAACRPLHWLYDRGTRENILQGSDPVFWPVSLSPFYSLPTGRRSCYNDVALAMLRSLPPDSNISFDFDSYLDEIMDMFKPSSEYAVAFAKRKEAYDPARKLEERRPIEGPWQHQAVTVLVGHLAKGEDISGNPSLAETDGFCSCIPLIARSARGYFQIEMTFVGCLPTRGETI